MASEQPLPFDIYKQIRLNGADLDSFKYSDILPFVNRLADIRPTPLLIEIPAEYLLVCSDDEFLKIYHHIAFFKLGETTEYITNLITEREASLAIV